MKNRVELEGFVLAEPEIRPSSSGNGDWGEFILSVGREWKSKDGRKYSVSDDIRIKCFPDTLPIAKQIAKKDARLRVTGTVQTNQWTSPETGKKKIFLNIVAGEIKELK